MKRFCAVLLLLVMVLTGSLVRAQDSEIITVTGLYSSNTQGVYRDILTPCDSLEVWDLATNSPAFTALSQVYAGLDSVQVFVELKGRYTAYEDEESHKDGVFEITEFVRHSTAAADITACGVNAPVSPDLVDGQCGSSRNSCVTGDYFDHEEGDTADTATHYRWVCLGAYGGDISEPCTAPKQSPPTLRGYVDVISRPHGPLTLSGWAYNTSASTQSILVEIYVGGAQGSGTLAATVSANQPRADVNATLGISGHHGFEWPLPATYQSSAQQFYVYTLDRTPNPTVRTQLTLSPISLLAPGHNEYCLKHGPCVAGLGDCDSNSECQSGLRCVDDVGARYGWRSIVDVCEAPASPDDNDYCHSSQHGPCSAGQGD